MSSTAAVGAIRAIARTEELLSRHQVEWAGEQLVMGEVVK
jgi:hypothetical protein